MNQGSGKEKRDTAAGCRDLALEDRRRAAEADSENGRLVFERSAASWESRANEIESGKNVSVDQRALDRGLWASGEEDEAFSDAINLASNKGSDPDRSRIETEGRCDGP